MCVWGGVRWVGGWVGGCACVVKISNGWYVSLKEKSLVLYILRCISMSLIDVVIGSPASNTDA